MKIINRDQLAALRAQYKPGTRVRLIRMLDSYTKLKPGDEGRVSFIDDSGTIFVDWNSGSTLGVVFEEDECEKIEE